MKLVIAAAVAVFVIPASAIANPMWIARMTVSSAPGPHILIAYQYDATYSDGTIVVETFHGTGHSVPKVGSDTSADTGSGYRPLKTREVCDCYVPTGRTLKYVLRSAYVSSEVSLSPSHSGPVPGTVCYAECASAPTLDAGMPVDVGTSDGTGGAPGTGGSTEPAGTGGAPGTGGSTEPAGTGGAPGTGGSTPLAGAGGALGSGGTTIPTGGTGGGEGKKGGFCAIASPARPLALPALGMLAGLALAVWRRRRA